jgi:periplasmic protein CpxP/Spy
MKMQLLTVAAAALMAAPMLHAQATTTPAPTASQKAMGQRGGHARMMNGLNLTADQQARIKAIHAKYAAQMKSARDASKPDFEAMKAARAASDTAAMRAARAKLQANMAPMQKVRQQEMAEIRSVLTPDQQTKFDAQHAKMQAKMNRRGQHGAWMGKRSAKHAHPATPAQRATPAIPATPAQPANPIS